MKRIQISFFTVLALAILSFTACKKEDIKDNGPKIRNWTSIQLMGDVEHGKCVPGFSLCLTTYEYPDNVSVFPTSTDQLWVAPYLSSDGKLNFEATIPYNRLSPEAKTQLLDHGFLDFKNDIELDEAIVRQAYEDAGLRYNGEKIIIQKGVYDAQAMENTDATGNTITIEVCFKGSDWSICITVEF